MNILYGTVRRFSEGVFVMFNVAVFIRHIMIRAGGLSGLRGSKPIRRLARTSLFVAALTLSNAALAAEFIGVAAALRGDVIRVSAASDASDLGPVSSGSKIFLGDEIEVASGGRMQIMLLDETVFTLGSGAKLTIDEFVYDPAAQTGSMTTQITKGAFRFVSGKLAKSSPKAMKVKLPSASISIRGTQVAGIVDEDGGSDRSCRARPQFVWRDARSHHRIECL